MTTSTIRAGLLLGVLVGASLTFPLFSGHAQQGQAKVTVSSPKDYPDLRAVVTALDARGIPVVGLTAAQFSAFDGDSPLASLEVQPVQDASVRLDVVIAIDISGSMAGQPLDSAKAAALQFVQQLGPNDEALIVSFNANVNALTAFTSDRTILASAINGLQAIGGTALYKAVQTSAFAAASAPSPRRAVVLLTDGVNEDTQSDATADGSVATTKNAGAPVFTVGFGSSPDVAYLQLLADTTQGQYRAATTADVSNVYGDIAALLRNQYIVTAKDPLPADGKTATLRIVATINGAPTAGTSAFVRGTAPIAPPQPTAIAASSKQRGGSSNPPFSIIATAGSIAVLIVVGFLVIRTTRSRRMPIGHKQIAGRQSGESIPEPELAGPIGSTSTVHGRVVALNGNQAQTVYRFDRRPLTIGSSRGCSIQLGPAPDVAPVHARLWMKDNKIMLRHLGGARRPTLVGANPIEWIILEDGDEFSVGRYRYQVAYEAGEDRGG